MDEEKAIEIRREVNIYAVYCYGKWVADIDADDYGELIADGVHRLGLICQVPGEE